MAHTCPVCGATCRCNGDIDDLCLDFEEDVLNCIHCHEDAIDYIDYKDDYNTTKDNGHRWCNLYHCWCCDAEDITEWLGNCDYNCNDCEYVEEVFSRK